MTLSTNVKLMKKKPMLIVVHNKDNSLVDSNVKDLTEQFLKDNDSTNIIREVFENVRCISLPDIDLVGGTHFYHLILFCISSLGYLISSFSLSCIFVLTEIR